MLYYEGMEKVITVPALGAYVRDQYLAGCHDPDEIAVRYLAEALAQPDPASWLLPAVRHAVGSSFSGIQAAVRGTVTRRAVGDPAGRQRHNEGYVYNPDTRDWIPLGQATVADFEAAITWHERMIAGHEHTITEYRDYIKKIKDAGATCLDDIR